LLESGERRDVEENPWWKNRQHSHVMISDKSCRVLGVGSTSFYHQVWGPISATWIADRNSKNNKPRNQVEAPTTFGCPQRNAL